jgi:hypothetical protein
MWGRNKEGWLCELIVLANFWLDLRARIAIGNEEREAGMPDECNDVLATTEHKVFFR